MLSIMSIADANGMEDLFVALVKHLAEVNQTDLSTAVHQVLPFIGPRYYDGTRWTTRFDIASATAPATTGSLRLRGLLENSARTWALLAAVLANGVLNRP
jgi:hypothetical protein